jgi:hypothetical protein
MRSIFELSSWMSFALSADEIARVLHAATADGKIFIPNDLLNDAVSVSVRIDAIRSIRNVYTHLFIPFVESITTSNSRVQLIAAECELWWERFPARWDGLHANELTEALVNEIEHSISTRETCALESAVYGAIHLGEENVALGERILDKVAGVDIDEAIQARVANARKYLSQIRRI